MPVESMALTDTDQSVFRPIVFDVLDQVFSITRLSKNTSIQFASKSGPVQTYGTSMENPNRNARFANGRYTFIEANEAPDLGAMQETHVHDNEFPPFFNDPKLGLSLRPVHTHSTVSIRIRYRSPSKTEVEQWMNEMYSRSARGRDISLISVAYGYSIPQPFLMAIRDVHTLRESVAGYGEDFETYLRLHLDPRVRFSSDRKGENLIYTINDRQGRINGFFDFTGVPEEPTRDEASGCWELSFGFSFKYQKPTSCFIRYPVIVHNQLLPAKYLEHLTRELDYETAPKVYTRSFEAFSEFELDTEASRDQAGPSYYRLPYFDDYEMEHVEFGTATLFLALCAVDTDGKYLLDLTDLQQCRLDPDILTFFRSEAPYLTQRYKSLFYLSLYIDDTLCDSSRLVVTPDLKVSAKEPLDFRRQHRLRLSLVVNVRMVDRRALDRLMAYPAAFMNTVGSINTALFRSPDFRDLGTRKTIKPYEFTRIFELLTDQRLHNGMNNGNAGWVPPPYGLGIDSDPRATARQAFLKDLTPEVLQEHYRKRLLTYRQQYSMIITHHSQ